MLDMQQEQAQKEKKEFILSFDGKMVKGPNLRVMEM